MPKGLLTGVIYIPLDVRWPRSKKVRALVVRHGLEGMAAWALYLAMACYCRENLSDGFVPAEEVGALAYPLPAEQADGLLKLLLDYRLVSEGHSQGHSQGHSGGHSPGHSGGYGDGYLVTGYLKRNGTKAEALEHAAQLAHAGRTGALTRWSAGAHSQGHSQGHKPGLSDSHDQTETETETSSAPAPARAPAHARKGWTPHDALSPPPAPKRGGGPRTTHANVQQVIADAHRPGGPAQDVEGAADAARKALANRQRPVLPEPAEPALHGEGLAAQQLAASRASRLPEPEPPPPEPEPAAADPEPELAEADLPDW
jgi:hypothetical protein